LTQEQRNQSFPIIQQELPKLQALKKDTSLKPEAKLEQLKAIADDLDSKITPLLNADQQKKFQEIREEHRRALIEKIGSEILQKAEYKVSGLFTDQHAQKGLSQK
jgi:exonuclease VII small subunit